MSTVRWKLPFLCLFVIAVASSALPVSAASATTYSLSFALYGRGTVTWSINGTPCQSGCLANLPTGIVPVPAGANVEVKAVPDPGWALDRWTLCTPDATDPTVCRLTMTHDATVGATFVQRGSPVLAPGLSGQHIERRTRHSITVQFTTDQAGTAHVSLVRCSHGSLDCSRYTVLTRTSRGVGAGVANVSLRTPVLTPGIYRVRIVIHGVSGRDSRVVQKTVVVRKRD